MKIKLRIYMMVVLLVALTQQMMAQQKYQVASSTLTDLLYLMPACSTEDTE